MKEKDYLDNAYQILSKREDILYVSTEVPILGRYADLAFIKENEIYTFEFKLNNCKKALIQSKDHMLGADFCYICMPKRNFNNSFLEEVSEAGIGLCIINQDKEWPFEEIVKPKKSVRKFKFAWENTLKHCLRKCNVI